jgi:hypothetical protein
MSVRRKKEEGRGKFGNGFFNGCNGLKGEGRREKEIFGDRNRF